MTILRSALDVSSEAYSDNRKQQLEAIGVIYSWVLYTVAHLEIEADYLFVWPPITTQELVTSFASSISFYKQVWFNAVLRRKCITYQPQWSRS